ncbi:MAG: zinc ribbon domain-containing protein [Endomicrobium sp.]|nr:zinc ribbon domain-containing protein [Endomicrobium sp.]
MKNCIRCARKIVDDAAFCGYCGQVQNAKSPTQNENGLSVKYNYRKDKRVFIAIAVVIISFFFFIVFSFGYKFFKSGMTFKANFSSMKESVQKMHSNKSGSKNLVSGISEEESQRMRDRLKIALEKIDAKVAEATMKVDKTLDYLPEDLKQAYLKSDDEAMNLIFEKINAISGFFRQDETLPEQEKKEREALTALYEYVTRTTARDAYDKMLEFPVELDKILRETGISI